MRKLFLFCALLTGLCPSRAQKYINRVRFMPDMPSPYCIRDWKQTARDYDALIFSFQEEGRFFPLNRWDDRKINYKGRSFSMTSYVGAPGGDEGINNLAAVVGATLAGIDKSDQNGYNFVAMCQKWFSSDNGVGLFANGLSADTDWRRLCDWYSSMPNMLAFQLSYLYPGDQKLREQVLMCADFFTGAADRLEREDREGVRDPGRQRDFGAAVAWMEYMAYNITGEARYLAAAEKGMEYVLRSEMNPLYEMLLPYGALAAVRMNAEQGARYDTGRILNWCFDGDAVPRHGWGVIADRWNGYDMHGLQGSVTDGDGYAFAMNTFQMAGSLTPLVRYDKGYARDIGKWMLNLVNNARMFYPDSYDKAHQSSYDWSKEYDPNSVIAYEGVRKWKRGWTTALCDYQTARGRVVGGDFRATHYLREEPVLKEVIAETKAGDSFSLDHVWEVELPAGVPDRWLVMNAGLTGASEGNEVEISVCDTPDGDYMRLFGFVNGERMNRAAKYGAIPREYRKLYVRASSHHAGGSGPDAFAVDALGVTFKDTVSPFATGDFVVAFVDLIDNCTTPIVAYRPEEVATDLGLYGSSHAGILGGIVSTTDVEGILQLDLLKTDYFHPEAYPSFLYYNPYGETRRITVDAGGKPCDLYDTVASAFVKKGVSGKTTLEIPARGACVIVMAPAGGNQTRQGGKLLIDGVVVDYGEL